MKNIKYKIKKLIVYGATVAIMTTTGCATTDEQPDQEEKAKIILSKDVEANKNLSNSELVCFNTALKEVRNQEEQKYNYDTEKQKYAMKCFDACGGAFIKRGKDCKYMPSKYEFNNNACSCNGQDIIPHKDKETVELKKQACQKICESANTGMLKYAADWDKTRSFGECVCKKIVEEKQNQH